jgi:GntR family transcriptional regulator / MocR family aminotransferase
MKNPFVVPDIRLDRSRLQSLRQQICLQMAEAIRKGALPEGTRLPSSRLLAKMLHVSRNTVVDAYESLLENGLIKTRAGSGVEVNQRAASVVPNFSNLRKTAQAAHYPVRTVAFEDPDGTPLYLNAK